MFFALIINLFTTRILLNALGVVDYGVYNVVAGFVSLFGFLNSTLSSSVRRFYNYEGATKGTEGFQNIYVIAMVTHAIIAFVILILLETFGLWYINNVMVVPNDRLVASNFLYQTSIASMILMMMQIPFLGAIMAKERMDYFAMISIIDVILRLLVALAVSYTLLDNLVTYGILLACVSVFDFLSFMIYCKRNFVELKMRRYFDKTLFKSMFIFSVWNLIGTFAFMLKGQGLNMLLNFFGGPIINAARGIAFQVNGAVSNFTNSIYTAFGPQVVTSYAEGNSLRTIRMMFTESKICFALITLIIVPVALEIDYLLRLWLGDVVPKYTNVFVILVLIDTLICTLNTPCTQVVQATGRIKKYQIGSTIVNLCLIPFALFLLSIGLSAISAFIATIIITIVNQGVCVYFTNKEVHFGLKNYFRQIAIPCLVLCLLMPLLPLLFNKLMTESFLRLIVVSVISILSGGVLSYFILLKENERIVIMNIIKSKINI